jgi:hypothetical protein
MSSKSSKRKKKDPEPKHKWKNAAEAMALYTKKEQPEGGMVPIKLCKPGSMIRGVRMAAVLDLMASFLDVGLLPNKAIYVVDRGKDCDHYKVIDGMHRLWTCEKLVDAEDDRFTHVSSFDTTTCMLLSRVFIEGRPVQIYAVVLEHETPTAAVLCIAFGTSLSPHTQALTHTP